MVAQGGDRVFVFVDGYEWHGGVSAQAGEDQRRRAALGEEGELVLAYEDVVGEPQRTIADIRAAVRGGRCRRRLPKPMLRWSARSVQR